MDDATRAKFYPTTDLVTGPDIIFFWVARMIMMTLHFRKEVPFHTVYVHGLDLQKIRHTLLVGSSMEFELPANSQ